MSIKAWKQENSDEKMIKTLTLTTTEAPCITFRAGVSGYSQI